MTSVTIFFCCRVSDYMARQVNHNSPATITIAYDVKQANNNHSASAPSGRLRTCFLHVKTLKGPSYKKRGDALSDEVPVAGTRFNRHGQFRIVEEGEISGDVMSLSRSKHAKHHYHQTPSSNSRSSTSTRSRSRHSRSPSISISTSTSFASMTQHESSLSPSEESLTDDSDEQENSPRSDQMMMADDDTLRPGALQFFTLHEEPNQEFHLNSNNNNNNSNNNNQSHYPTAFQSASLAMDEDFPMPTNDRLDMNEDYSILAPATKEEMTALALPEDIPTPFTSAGYLVFVKTHGGKRASKQWFAMQHDAWYKMTIHVPDATNSDEIDIRGVYYSAYRSLGDQAPGLFKTKPAPSDTISPRAPLTVLSGAGSSCEKVFRSHNIFTIADLAALAEPTPHALQLREMIKVDLQHACWLDRFIEIAVQALRFLTHRSDDFSHHHCIECIQPGHHGKPTCIITPEGRAPLHATTPVTPFPIRAPQSSLQSDAGDIPSLALRVVTRLRNAGVMSYNAKDDRDHSLHAWSDRLMKACWSTFAQFPYHTIHNHTDPSLSDYYIMREDFMRLAGSIMNGENGHGAPLTPLQLQTMWIVTTLPWKDKNEMTLSAFFRLFSFLYYETRFPIMDLRLLLDFLHCHMTFFLMWSEDTGLPLFATRPEAEKNLMEDEDLLYRFRFCEGRYDRFIDDGGVDLRHPVLRQAVVSFRKMDANGCWLRNEFVHHVLLVSGKLHNKQVIHILGVDGRTIYPDFNFLNEDFTLVQQLKERAQKEAQRKEITPYRQKKWQALRYKRLIDVDPMRGGGRATAGTGAAVAAAAAAVAALAATDRDGSSSSTTQPSTHLTPLPPLPSPASASASASARSSGRDKEKDADMAPTKGVKRNAPSNPVTISMKSNSPTAWFEPVPAHQSRNHTQAAQAITMKAEPLSPAPATPAQAPSSPMPALSPGPGHDTVITRAKSKSKSKSSRTTVSSSSNNNNTNTNSPIPSRPSSRASLSSTSTGSAPSTVPLPLTNVHAQSPSTATATSLTPGQPLYNLNSPEWQAQVAEALAAAQRHEAQSQLQSPPPSQSSHHYTPLSSGIDPLQAFSQIHISPTTTQTQTQTSQPSQPTTPFHIHGSTQQYPHQQQPPSYAQAQAQVQGQSQFDLSSSSVSPSPSTTSTSTSTSTSSTLPNSNAPPLAQLSQLLMSISDLSAQFSQMPATSQMQQQHQQLVALQQLAAAMTISSLGLPGLTAPVPPAPVPVPVPVPAPVQPQVQAPVHTQPAPASAPMPQSSYSAPSFPTFSMPQIHDPASGTTSISDQYAALMAHTLYPNQTTSHPHPHPHPHAQQSYQPQPQPQSHQQATIDPFGMLSNIMDPNPMYNSHTYLQHTQQQQPQQAHMQQMVQHNQPMHPNPHHPNNTQQSDISEPNFWPMNE